MLEWQLKHTRPNAERAIAVRAGRGGDRGGVGAETEAGPPIMRTNTDFTEIGSF